MNRMVIEGNEKEEERIFEYISSVTITIFSGLNLFCISGTGKPSLYEYYIYVNVDGNVIITFSFWIK